MFLIKEQAWTPCMHANNNNNNNNKYFSICLKSKYPKFRTQKIQKKKIKKQKKPKAFIRQMFPWKKDITRKRNWKNEAVLVREGYLDIFNYNKKMHTQYNWGLKAKQ